MLYEDSHVLYILQVTQLATMSAISVMTSVPIATQKPMYDYIGHKGCQFYWGVNITYQNIMVNSGVGMAIYRLICFQNLFKKNVNNKKITQLILLTELALVIIMLIFTAFIYTSIGWEKAIFYQFCMNMGTVEANTFQKYSNKNTDFDPSHLKGVRFVLHLYGQGLFIAELAIYTWILFNLWKHNKRNHSEGIITEHMKKERNQKNVITLYGQVLAFLVETAFNIYALVHFSNLSMFEASFMPISQIVASTIISAIQLATSHEMRRFLRNQFNLY